MLRVGLTGGAGSGKSTVAAMLQQLGAFVSKSDEIGRAMMQPGQAVFQQIVDHFGPEVLRADGSLDRAMLAHIAFQDGRVEELNRIVHPAVIAAQRDWMGSVAAQSPDAVAVVESALLFETQHGAAGGAEAEIATKAPWRTRFDRIVLVTAPEELRLKRYLQRENASVQDAQSRFAAQMSDQEKAAMSEFVLSNEGTVSELQKAVERLYVQLRTESSDQCHEGDVGQRTGRIQDHELT